MANGESVWRHAGRGQNGTPVPIRHSPLAIRVSYDTPNFISLIASKFCTPPPTRLVV